MSTTEETYQSHQASAEGIDLLNDEFVLENRTPALANWWKSILVGALFALSALSSAASGSVSGLITSGVIAALIAAYVYYSRSQGRYIVTTQ